MNPKQRRFVDEYLKTPNASLAARAAGYSKKNSNVVGPRLLADVGIAQAIDEGQKRLQAKAGVTAERVIQELWAIAQCDVRKVFNNDGTLKDIQDIPSEIAAAISSIEVDEENPGIKKVKFWSKTEALGLLGKNLRLFVERQEHSGPHGGPIPVRQAPIDFSGLTTDELKHITGINGDARK